MYSKYEGFKHEKTTPVYPQTNDLVENFNRMIEKDLRTSDMGNNGKR